MNVMVIKPTVSTKGIEANEEKMEEENTIELHAMVCRHAGASNQKKVFTSASELTVAG